MLLVLLWGCGTPSCDDLTVQGTSGEEATVRSAIADYNAWRGTETCVGEVVVGDRTTARLGKLGLSNSVDLRSQVFHDLCYLEDADSSLSVHDVYDGSGLRGDDAARYDLARACGRFGGGDTLATLAEDTCGTISTERDRITGSLFSNYEPSPVELGRNSYFNIEGPVVALAGLGQGLLFMALEPTNEPAGYRIVDAVGDGLSVASEVGDFPTDGPVEVYPGTDQVLVRQGGSMHRVSAEGYVEVAPVAPVGAGQLAQDASGWWWLSVSGDELRSYDPDTGMGTVVEAPLLTSIHSSALGIWWLGADGVLEQPATGLRTRIPRGHSLIGTTGGKPFVSLPVENAPVALSYDVNGWQVDQVVCGGVNLALPGGESRLLLNPLTDRVHPAE